MKIGALEISPSLLAINPHLREVAPQTRRSRPRATLGTPTVRRDGGGFHVEISGLALKLSLNSRVHWGEHARIVKRQRAVVRTVLATHRPPSLPCVVTLTRVGPRELNDDNATGTCKGTRDEVAAWLGTTDEDSRVTWRVEQAIGAYAVRIDIQTREDR